MEFEVLYLLKFNLLFPSSIKFFEYLSLNFNFDKTAHYLGKYLMESFLLDTKYMKYKPSIIASACAYIVMKFFKMKNYKDSYNKIFYNYDGCETKYSEHNVKDCAKDICLFVDSIHTTKYLACQKKYSKEENCKVSLLILGN